MLKLDACQVDLFRFIFSQLETSQRQLGGPVEHYEQWAWRGTSFTSRDSSEVWDTWDSLEQQELGNSMFQHLQLLCLKKTGLVAGGKIIMKHILKLFSMAHEY